MFHVIVNNCYLMLSFYRAVIMLAPTVFVCFLFHLLGTSDSVYLPLFLLYVLNFSLSPHSVVMWPL